MANAIREDEALTRLIPKCKNQGFSFISFVDGNGVPIGYVNNRTLVNLECNECGFRFNRMYTNIVSKSYKCPNCLSEEASSKSKKPLADTLEKIKEECQKRMCSFNGFCDKDGNDIEYDGVENAYLKLRCNICGNSWNSTVYKNFVNGKGCPQCANNKRLSEEEAKTLIEEVSRRKDITFNGFCGMNGASSRFVSLGNTFLLLKCNKCGYEWNTTVCSSFKNTKCGCPRCHTSLLECEIYDFLSLHYKGMFEYNRYYDWLGGLQLDFYIPSLKVAIECQGKQHFIKDSGWRKTKEGKEREFLSLLERDDRKRILCKKNDVRLLYFSNLGIDYPYDVIEDKNELLKEIERNGYKQRL